MDREKLTLPSGSQSSQLPALRLPGRGGPPPVFLGSFRDKRAPTTVTELNQNGEPKPLLLYILNWAPKAADVS